jgi:hypothetical protein
MTPSSFEGPDFQTRSHTGEGLDEWLVDLLRDINALGGDADLARVEEGAHGDLRRDFGNVDVWKNDARVVATPVR